MHRLYYEFVRYFIYGLAIGWFRVRYFGRRNIPREGGVLVVSNHQSHLDPPLMGVGIPQMGNYVARATLFRSPIFSRLIRSVNAFPLDRDGIGLAGIKTAMKLLKRGETVVIFPEGTRTRDGQIGEFRPGFTTLAVRTGAAILPAAIEGAYQAFPHSGHFPRPHPVHIGYGKPISADEIKKYDERELLAVVERRVRACHEELRRHADFATSGG
jgi:1-acyl-sn-glycerol-3-phosphate acyltransferase